MVSTRGPLHRLFALYRGEGRKAFHFGLFSFAVALVSVCGETLGDGIFLEQVGSAGLPLAFLTTALGMIVVSTCLLFALGRYSIEKIIVGICAVFFAFEAVIFLHLVGKGIAPVGPWLWYALQAGNYMFLTAMFVTHWTFLDEHYDLQDAKRLYGLFNASLITGCAAGSGIVSLLLRQIGPHGILLVMCGLMCVASAWVLLLSRLYNGIVDDTIDQEPKAEKGSLRTLFRTILQSRFTFLLLISSIVVEILSTITECNYMGALTHHFTADHQLTLFLSRCRTCIYALDVLVGLFLYGRMVKRFGSSRIFIVPSLYFTLLFAMWPGWSGLVICVLALFAVEGVLYSIDDSNFNLLINAVPTRIKAPVRVIIESFFEPVGMCAAALILMAIEFDSRWLGLALAGVSLVICVLLRRGYSKALFANLSVHAIHFDRSAAEWVKGMGGPDRLRARERLIEAMHDERRRDLATEGLLLLEEPSILSHLLDQIQRTKGTKQLKMIEQLEGSGFASSDRVVKRMESWSLTARDDQLREAAQLYLAKKDGLPPSLRSSHSLGRGARILLSQELPPLQALLDSTQEEEILYGLSLARHMEVDGMSAAVRPLLDHPSSLVRKEAMVTFAKMATLEEAEICLDHLYASSETEVRVAALKALFRFDEIGLVRSILLATVHLRPSERRLAERLLCEMGGRVVPTLLEIVQEVDLPDRCRLLAGRVVGRLSLHQLQGYLRDLMGTEIQRAYFYFYHYAAMQLRYPEHDLHILTDGFQTRFHSVIDFIIQLLGIADSLKDGELLSRSLRSHNQKIHSQAVETLRDTCDLALFKKLEPLVDDRPFEEKIHACMAGGYPLLSLSDLLEWMTTSSSPADRIISTILTEKVRQSRPSDARATVAFPLHDEGHFAREVVNP